MKLYIYRATSDVVNEIEVEFAGPAMVRVLEPVTLVEGDIVSRTPPEGDEEPAQKLPSGGN